MTTSSSTQAGPAVVPEEICEAIRAGDQIALISHVTPDADALASCGSLWLALPELGKHPHLVLPAGSVSRQLSYLVDRAGLEACHAEDLESCDLIVALDTAKERRLNMHEPVTLLTKIPVVNIDHHATNPSFGRWNWVVGSSSSTSELVHALLKALGCQITPTIATLLYAGMHTDTQGFSLSNTGANTLRVAYELALAGAEIVEVCERMHRSRSRGEFQLLSRVYQNTRVSDDGRVAWSTASHEEITGAGCKASDIDDQVEVPRSIEGISLAILFSEGEQGTIRMNFRGERGVSVLELAQQFGGGGHHASAGAKRTGTMEDVINQVLPAALRFAANLPKP